MIVKRRSFLIGLGALIAAPAIVRPESLMAISPIETIKLPSNSLLTVEQITRASVRMFTDSNAFIRNINEQYDAEFGAEGAAIGATLRIRLPNDYVVLSGPAPLPMPELSALEMATIGAAAVLAKNPAMSRRFWARS